MTQHSAAAAGPVRAPRTLIAGSAMCVLIAAWGPYNLLVLRGSCLTIDFSTGAAIAVLFFAAFFLNGLLRAFLPVLSLSSGELSITYLMAAIACSICTMGLTLQLVPLVPAMDYLASPENEWARDILPYVPHWLRLQGEDVILGFYEGLSEGESIPWGAWAKPLLAWMPVIVGLYLVMISLAVLFSRQWIEHERLAYPLAQVPLVMTSQEEGRALNAFFRNPVMWLGFSVPFTITGMNGLHFYHHFVPNFYLSTHINLFHDMPALWLNLTFSMMGFAYLVHQEVALSVWLFYLVGYAVSGVFSQVGITRSVTLDFYAQRDGGPIFSYVQFGALMALVGYTLWTARGHLRGSWRAAWRSSTSSAGDAMSMRSVYVQLILGLVLMTGWFTAAGVPLWAGAAFVLVMTVTFLGITRILCEAGLARTRAQLPTPTVLRSMVGTAHLGPAGTIGVLGYGQVWMSDVRTFVMAAAANGLKLTASIRGKALVLGSTVLAVVLALVASIGSTLYFAYESGAHNANSWFFIRAPRYIVDFAAGYVREPAAVDAAGLGLMGLGGAGMLGLYWIRAHFLGFPIHPLGLAVSQMALTRHMWFSMFVVWLLKAVMIRYGGPRLLLRVRPFFLGFILGEFVALATWLMIDLVTGAQGNSLFNV